MSPPRPERAPSCPERAASGVIYNCPMPATKEKAEEKSPQRATRKRPHRAAAEKPRRLSAKRPQLGAAERPQLRAAQRPQLGTAANAPQRRAKRLQSAENAKPLFDPARCKRCGICAHFCPFGAIALREDGTPYLAKPEACTACRLCEEMCPDWAIRLAAPSAGEGDKENQAAGQEKPARPKPKQSKRSHG